MKQNFVNSTWHRLKEQNYFEKLFGQEKCDERYHIKITQTGEAKF